MSEKSECRMLYVNIGSLFLIKQKRVGYWTFNTTFLKNIEQLNSTDPTKAGETLLSGLVEYEYKWLNECWKTGNESAKANSQTNTLARVVVFPTDDPTLVIDPIYKLATPILLACWEREKDGDINVPIISHTQDLIFAFNWDKEYALNFIKNQQKDFTPVTQQDADINPPPKAGPSSSKPRPSSPPEPNSSKSFKPLLEHVLYISLFYILILFII